MRIYDQFIRSSFLIAIDKLCSRNCSLRDGSLPPSFDKMPAEKRLNWTHSFYEPNFSELQRCHICSELLLGIFKQGFLCRGELEITVALTLFVTSATLYIFSECGLCCHRTCAANGVPECGFENRRLLSSEPFIPSKENS